MPIMDILPHTVFVPKGSGGLLGSGILFLQLWLREQARGGHGFSGLQNTADVVSDFGEVTITTFFAASQHAVSVGYATC